MKYCGYHISSFQQIGCQPANVDLLKCNRVIRSNTVKSSRVIIMNRKITSRNKNKSIRNTNGIRIVQYPGKNLFVQIHQ